VANGERAIAGLPAEENVGGKLMADEEGHAPFTSFISLRTSTPVESSTSR
jgi:hypothetical protein